MAVDELLRVSGDCPLPASRFKASPRCCAIIERPLRLNSMAALPHWREAALRLDRRNTPPSLTCQTPRFDRLEGAASLIHSNISFTHLLRIERPCRLHLWGEQSSTKSKTGLSEKQSWRLKARQRLLCRCVRSLTPRRRGAGCRRFEHRSSSVHWRMPQSCLCRPVSTSPFTKPLRAGAATSQILLGGRMRASSGS